MRIERIDRRGWIVLEVFSCTFVLDRCNENTGSAANQEAGVRLKTNQETEQL